MSRWELRSNSLEFDIVAADPAWLQQSLFTAQSILENPGSTDQQKTAALRTLRFLADPPASVLELVRQLAKPEKDLWDPVAGLAGSRQQTLVVKELEQQLGAPDTAITSNYIYVLAKLKSQLGKEPLPAYPKDDQQKQVAWHELARRRSEEFAALEDDLYRTTPTLVQKKWGSARAETVRTLLMRPAHTSGDIKPLNSVPEGDVVSSFRALSLDEQESLLSFFWERLNLSAMVAPLEEIAQRPQVRNAQLRDRALLRLYQLDASTATPLFLEEIAHPHIDNGIFTVNGDTLGLLPNETLPQFDQVLAARAPEQRKPHCGARCSTRGPIRDQGCSVADKGSLRRSTGRLGLQNRRRLRPLLPAGRARLWRQTVATGAQRLHDKIYTCRHSYEAMARGPAVYRREHECSRFESRKTGSRDTRPVWRRRCRRSNVAKAESLPRSVDGTGK